MEPETCTAAQGEDSDKDQNVRDSPPTAGEKSDEGQQIISEGTINWFKILLAFDYLQPAFVSIVKDEMTILQEQIKINFGRKLCAEATAKDIIPVNKTMAQFSHRCTAKGSACQTLIFLILQQTYDCVQSYKMFQGTDPQKWLTSPFEFVLLFLEDWMRWCIHDFPECDITALCSLVKRCKPLMQMFAHTNIDEVKKVRNRTMHQARLTIGLEEMEQSIDVILDFLHHIKALKNMDEITKAIDTIEKLRTGDVILLHGMLVQQTQGWLSSAQRQLANKDDVVNDLHQNIVYMENELARVTSGREAATTIQKVEEMKIQAKIEKRTDEIQKINQKNEDMANVNSNAMENAADQMSSKGVHLYNPDAENDDTFDQKNQDGERHSCWYKTTMALKCMQPAVVPIVENKIRSLYKETVSKFGPKPCANAKSDDIRKSKNTNTAIFLHTCPPGTLVPCQVLLDIIKEHTSESFYFFEMIKCTDPQTWLDSPIDFVCLFIDKGWRCKINDFKDCDITVLCQIVKRCKPLMLMFNKEKLDSVKEVRNQLMHKAEMGITQKEMEDNLAAILDFLEYVKTFNDTDEVTKAIDCIQQLQANDPQFFLRHICSKLIQEVLTDAKVTYEHKKAATNDLLQNIMFMKGEQERLHKTPETPCTEDTDVEMVKMSTINERNLEW